MELSGGKVIEMAANSGCGSGGSSEFDGLRKSGSGSGGDGSGSDSGGGAGGGIFLKSAGGVDEGAIGSSCRLGAGPSNVVEKATGIYFLKMSSSSIEVTMVLFPLK